MVVLIAFGYFILGSIGHVVSPSATPPLTNSHFLNLILLEPVLAAIALAVLHLQGRSFKQFGLAPGWKDTLVGVGLGLGAFVAVAIVSLFVQSVLPIQRPATGLVAPDIAFGILVAVSVINPLFEEFFVSGYIITAVKEWKGLWPAINLSVAIRLLYHLYQGPLGVIGIIPIGIVFAYWYGRTGRLWPLVVAHALFDFFGVLAHLNAGT